MQSLIPHRLVLAWGGAAALVIAPQLALAQDGQPATGPPVTAPRTNKNLVNEDRPITDSPPPETSAPLTPVPATADDPAPPGTRGVRVDTPAGTPTVTGEPATRVAPGGVVRPGVAPAPGAARANNGIQMMEGVVTRIDRPGRDLPEERIRITVDPNQDWVSYATTGPMGLPDRTTARTTTTSRTTRTSGRTVPAPPAADVPPTDRPQGVPMVVARRTYVSTFARSPEGYTLFGVDTPSSPEVQISRSGSTVRPVVPVPGPKPASFANIKEGSYVAVHFRRIGNVNEVLSLSLIELPTNPTPPTAAPVGDTGGPSPAGGLTRPSGQPIGAPNVVPRPGLPPAATTVAPGVPATPPAATSPGGIPARVPTVPTRPTAPSVGPQ